MPLLTPFASGATRTRAQLSLASLILLSPSLVLAQTATSTAADSATTTTTATSSGAGQLPSVEVVGSGDGDGSYTARKPPQVGKSSTPLAETPQSITVVPRAVLDSQQAQSLSDALANVPGVVSNQFGRRGWDDLIIRGQTASGSLYLDGLRTSANNRVAEQLYGFEQIEVLKGPASLLYGVVLPGGLVNMVSKRPQAEAFANTDVTVGSHDLYQATVDMGTPLTENGKAAFRVNGVIMNSNDATNYVWYRDRYVAPSLSLDFGTRTDFTILTSYQERSYIRQQGLPPSGSILTNRNGPISRSLFTGEPTESPYVGQQSRIGYALTHRFDNGWTVNNNFRWEQYALTGVLVSAGALSANGQSLARTATAAHWDGDTYTMDTNAQRSFATFLGKQTLTVGTDYLINNELSTSTACTLAALNLYNPVYGAKITCAGATKSSSTTVRTLGVYLRDQINFTERLQLLAGLRRDSASTYSTDLVKNVHTNVPSSANTGSAALMYEVLPGVRPYVSFATSFYPNSGTDVNGNTFKPETGSQSEVGVKFEFDQGRSNVTLAAFNLRRQNVLETDPNNTTYSIAVGEERSRGFELGFTSDFKNGLSIMGGYAYTAAVIADDGGQTPTTVGQWLNNVPRQTFNTTARYRFGAALSGWELNGGVRGASRAHAYTYQVPGYVLADVGVAYNAARWRTALNVKNIFNRQYYTGGVANAVGLGDDRMILLTLGYRY